MTMPDAGTPAPIFALLDEAGHEVRLSDFHGKRVVLYFYPKDSTPGCTKEACSFRDNFAALTAEGVVVLGISADTQSSHQKFSNKYELPFHLLVDSDHAVARGYGAFGLKKNYGREYEGIIRSTVVIGPDGRVEKTFARVKPDTHGTEVLDWIKAHPSP